MAKRNINGNGQNYPEAESKGLETRGQGDGQEQRETNNEEETNGENSGQRGQFSDVLEYLQSSEQLFAVLAYLLALGQLFANLAYLQASQQLFASLDNGEQSHIGSNYSWKDLQNSMLAKIEQTIHMIKEMELNLLVLVKRLETRMDSMASDIKDIREHTDGWQRQQRNQVSVAVNTDFETEETAAGYAQTPRTENGLEYDENATVVKDVYTGRSSTGHEGTKAVTNQQTDREREIEDICFRVVNRVLASGQYQQEHQQIYRDGEFSSCSEELNLAYASPQLRNSNQISSPSRFSCCSCKKCSCLCHSINRMKESKGKRNKRRFLEDSVGRKQHNKRWQRKTGQVSFMDDADKRCESGFDSFTYSNDRQDESKSSAGNEQHSCTEEPESLACGGHLLYPCDGPVCEGLKEKIIENDEETIGHEDDSESDSELPQGDSNARNKKTKQCLIDWKSGACGGYPEDPSDGSDSAEDSKKDRAKDSRDDKGRNKDSDDESLSFDWKIDIDSWKVCIEDGDEIKAEQLLSEKILPDDKLLQQANLKFGRTSKTVSDICTKISEFVSKESKEIVDVWAAYEYKTDCDYDIEAKVMFVVCTATNIDKINITTYKTFQTCITEIKRTENQIIREREQDISVDDDEMKQIIQCMKDNSVTLMNSHSNITRISVSCIKSKGYGTEFSSLNQDLCIVLYVDIKGLIPIGEDPFPTNIGIYSVDVREGVFLPLAGPFEHHEQIKMGCAVRGDMVIGGGEGTLGGFVEHNNETYCITSAHVMFGDDHFKDLQKTKFISFGPQETYLAYQPTSESAKPFGTIAKAVYREGGGNDAGVEAVLICMHERFPNSGHFPDGKNYREGGFENVMSYTSGKTLETTDLRRRTEVIKYGSYSHVTRGSFKLDGASIRFKNAHGRLRSLNFLLHNQIEIEKIGNDPFALLGDSGALVMIEENGDLVAIGILEGEMDGTYIVTPICDVLEALQIPRNQSLKRFRQLTLATNRSSENSQQTPATHPNATPDSGISIYERISPDSNDFLKHLESKVTYLSERLASVEQDLPQDVARHAAENRSQTSKRIDSMERQLQQQSVENTLQNTEIKDRVTEKITAVERQLQQQSVEHRNQNTEIQDQMTEKITAVERQLQQQSVEHRNQNTEIKDQMTEKITAVERQLQQQSVEHRNQNTEIKDQMTEKITAVERQLQQQSVEHRNQNTEIKDQMTEKITAIERQLQQQSEEHKKQNTEVKDQMTERIDALGRQLERKSEEQNQEIKNQMVTITQLLREMNIKNQKKE